MGEKVISLWRDEASEPGESRWIVSRDSLGHDGGSETTDTVGVWDNYEGAKREAVILARREGKRLVK